MYWKQLADQKSGRNNSSIIEKPKKEYTRTFLGPEFPGVYLTAREEECSLLLLEGMTLKEIAKILGLSPRTVEFYLKNIKTKLNCRTKFHMMRALIISTWYKELVSAL